MWRGLFVHSKNPGIGWAAWVALIGMVMVMIVPSGGTRLQAQAQPAPSPVEASSREIHLLTIEGIINPLTSRYLRRGLERAETSEAEAVVVRLNTPGGLESSMREMVQDMLAAQIPVIVYVTPPGAHAASAGMFLTIAAHIAAMSPGTNIGAAHPVGIGESSEQEVMTAKVVNDAAALARAIAADRDRNADWPERAVRRSDSITAEEALKMRVIDVVAPDLDTLFEKIDGRTVSLPRGPTQLQTLGSRVVEFPMSLPERVLQALTDPNIAYLLMMIGFIGILAELYSPGLLFPGLTGVIALVLAFASLGSLPIGWAGIALLVLALILWTLELQTEGLGILAVIGLVAFILGSLMLYQPLVPVSPALPRVRVSPWVIAAMSVLVFGFFSLVLRAVLKTSHRPPAVPSGQELVGQTGLAVSNLSPSGTIVLDSEPWTAVAEEEKPPITAGEHVKVTAVEGVVLRVKRSPELNENSRDKEI